MERWFKVTNSGIEALVASLPTGDIELVLDGASLPNQLRFANTPLAPTPGLAGGNPNGRSEVT